jgi:hypothetical protein
MSGCSSLSERSASTRARATRAPLLSVVMQNLTSRVMYGLTAAWTRCIKDSKVLEQSSPDSTGKVIVQLKGTSVCMAAHLTPSSGDSSRSEG